MPLIKLVRLVVVVVAGGCGQKVGGERGWDERGKTFFSLVRSELRLAGLLQCSGGPHVSFPVGSLSLPPQFAFPFSFSLSSSNARIRLLDLNDHHRYTTPKYPPVSAQRPLHFHERSLPPIMVSPPAPSIHRSNPYTLPPPIQPLQQLIRSPPV